MAPEVHSAELADSMVLVSAAVVQGVPDRTDQDLKDQGRKVVVPKIGDRRIPALKIEIHRALPLEGVDRSIRR